MPTIEDVPSLSKTLNDEVIEVVVTENQTAKLGCGIMGRYPVITLLSFVGAGIGLGIGLSVWQPDDPQAKETCLQWIGLVGVLFLR